MIANRGAAGRRIDRIEVSVYDRADSLQLRKYESFEPKTELTAVDLPTARPLPAYFTRYPRLLGSRKVPVERGSPDSGDIHQSAG